MRPLELRRGATALGFLILIGVGYLIYATRDRTGETMLVWEPTDETPYPANTVNVYIRSRSLVRDWELAIEGYKIGREPVLRIYEVETQDAYAGPDSSVMTIGQFGDTLYWCKTWAVLEKER